MRRLHRLILLALLATALPLLADVEIGGKVPADTMLFGRIDLNRVRASELGTDLLAQHDDRLAAFQTLAVEHLGLDPQAIHTAWVLAPAPKRGLIVFQGTFSAEEIAARFGILPNVVLDRREGTLFAARMRDAREPDFKLVALLDRTTLVVGDLDTVDRFLKAQAEPRLLLPADHPRLKRLLAAEEPLVATFLGRVSDWPDMDRNLGAIIDEVWLSGTVGTDVELTLKVSMRDARQADAIAKVAWGMAVLKLADPAVARKPLLAALLASVGQSVEDSTAVITGKLSGQTVRDLLAKQLPAGRPQGR